MAEDKRRAALVIGVGDAKPLPYLGGAVNSARLFADWTVALGYESKLVTDEDGPVTIKRLQDALEALLKPATIPIHRLVLYFAGHGLIREAEEGLWLLSDWHSALRAVAAEALRRRLYMYNIRQIAIFADACRSLPRDVDAADLVSDAVLGRGPTRSQTTPEIDKFVAAQDGYASYMIPGSTPEEDRCLFSGVLLEGLWGMKPGAFSTLVRGKITGRSLCAYLQAEVPQVATRYKRTLVPNASSTFAEGDDIYFGDGTPPQPPVFPAWPRPETLEDMGVDAGTPDEKFGVRRLRGGGRRGRRAAERPAGRTHDRDVAAPALLEKLRKQPRPSGFETGSGFAVDGGTIRAVWTAAGIFARSQGKPNWWRIGQETGIVLRRPAPVLIEFKDGLFAALAALPRFIATVLRDRRGVLAQVYHETGSQQRTAAVVEEALARLEGGVLRADAATDLAVQLRQMKHVDPVLGVISAYLYDSIGDIESIRRMAFYYIQHNQPIPYDIALLAHLVGEWRNGLLWAHVPAVPGREPRTDAEKEWTWTYAATRARDGVVGGLWPWMRQGWTFLDDPADDGSTLVLPGLIELMPHLRPSRFTTFDAEGGRAVARRFNIKSGD